MNKAITTVFSSAAILMLAGCGGSSGHAAPPPPAKPARNPAQARVAGRTYAVKLASANEVPRTPGGATAKATITIARSHDQVCWRIANLTSVPTPSHAYIDRGYTGASGPIVLALDRSYQPVGCVAGAAPALLAAIEAHPASYYLDINSRQQPAGAIRGQL
jgi:hypothetical protein